MEITTLLDEFICAALVHNQAQNTEQQLVTGAFMMLKTATSGHLDSCAAM